jgi:hypothetical protein
MISDKNQGVQAVSGAGPVAGDALAGQTLEPVPVATSGGS